MINAENNETKDCNCRKKKECPLDGKCRSGDIIQKYVVTATGHPRKAYLSTAEGQKVILSIDIKTTKSYLEIENMKMRHHYQNTSAKQEINTISAQI